MCYEVGMVNYLSKPVNINKLEKLLKEYKLIQWFSILKFMCFFKI